MPVAFAVAACSFVLVFATAGTPIPLYNLYQAQDGITHADLGAVSVGYFVAAAGSLLILGRISNHWGRRPVALTAVASAVFSCLILVREVDWDNVGLITTCARQPAETDLLECRAAFVLSHLVMSMANSPGGNVLEAPENVIIIWLAPAGRSHT
jgi:MFS family permease